MRILKITTNLAAIAKYKFKRFLSASNSPSNARRVPASGGTALSYAWSHLPDLKPGANISTDLMLAVEHVRNRTRDYSVISTEGDSFQVLHENPPNFSILRTANYNHEIRNCDYYVLGSCHKWMLLKSLKFPEFPYELLWNPTTYEVRPLPFFAWPPLTNDGQWLVPIWRCYGMWFDHASEDCKVLRYGQLDDPIEENKTHAELFSLKAGYWKEIPYPLDPTIWPSAGPLVNINGISYWTAFPAPSPSGKAIVSFDFASENFPLVFIPIPESPIPGSNRLHNNFCFFIAEFRGFLAAYVYDQPLPRVEKNKPFGFEIWVWNENNWFLHSIHDVPPLADDVCVETVVGLYKNDKALLQGSNGSLLLYDCHTKVLKDLGIRDEVRSTNVYPYVQSM